MKLFEKGKVFTLANIFSILRIPLSFLIWWAVTEGNGWFFGIVTILAIVTDYADGYFARRFKKVSELGKVLDPLGDFFCLVLGVLALYIYGYIPALLFIVIVGLRGITILGMLVILTVSKILSVSMDEIPSAKLSSKITVNVIAVTLLVHFYSIDLVMGVFDTLTYVGSAVTFIDYGLGMVRIIGDFHFERKSAGNFK